MDVEEKEKVGSIFMDKDVPNGKDSIKVEEVELKKGGVKSKKDPGFKREEVIIDDGNVMRLE